VAGRPPRQKPHSSAERITGKQENKRESGEEEGEK